MLMIILHHLVIKGADTCGYLTPYELSDGLRGGTMSITSHTGTQAF